MKKNCVIVDNNGKTIRFTPSAMAEGTGEHVTISMVTPKTFIRQHQVNSYYGRHEIAVHIPADFSGAFYLYIMVGRKSVKLFRLCIEAKNGTVTHATVLPDDHDPEDFEEPYLNIRFPYEAWYHYPNASWCRY